MITMKQPMEIHAFFDQALRDLKINAEYRSPVQAAAVRVLQPFIVFWMEQHASAWIGMWRGPHRESRGRCFALVPTFPVDENGLFKTDGLSFVLEQKVDETNPLTCRIKFGDAVPWIRIDSTKPACSVGGWRVVVRTTREEVLQLMATDETSPA